MLLLLAVALPACRPRIDEESVEFKVPVSVREVATDSVRDVVRTSGTLRAPETVQLRAETTGELKIARQANGRRIGEGDSVRAGAKIAEITGDDVRLAARTEATEQRYRSAKRDLDSKQVLFDQGLISEIELRAAEDAYVDAKIELDRSKLTVTRSTLVTPISGVVLTLARDERNQPIAEGQLVTQGQVIAQVAPLGNLVADVDLIGRDIARVKSGLKASVLHHAWPDEPFDGRVRRIAPSIDPATRALRAEVEIANSAGRLRPGMFVDVSLVVDERADVAVVPRRAVVERGGRKVVFVVKGQKVEETEVRLGFGDDDVVEIVEGLEPGDRVVITGLETLTDQASVRVTGS